MNKLKSQHLKITEKIIHLYAEASNDYNPIHVDREFAEATPMKGIIAHGTLSLNLLWRSLEETFGSSPGKVYSMDVRFKAPVREGDLITASGELIGETEYAVRVCNQDGHTVIEGKARIT